jgi:hypothetical protein
MHINLLPKQKITLSVSKDSDEEFFEVIPLQITNNADYPLTFGLTLHDVFSPGDKLHHCQDFQYPEV